jgi:hypothetical protein
MAKSGAGEGNSIVVIVLTPGSDVSHTEHNAFALCNEWILKTYCP